jgi:hypothetical protein
MIELDEVFAARCFLIAPVPADRDRRVKEVVNVIVRDEILAALQDDTPTAGGYTMPPS